jgi:hypothetical protein
MTNLITPPDDLSTVNSDIRLAPFNLAKEAPELHSVFEAHKAAAGSIPSPQATGSWYRSGLGPTPTTGGIWVGGTILEPFSTPPTEGLVTSVAYGWDNTHLGGWTSQVSVRLVITNAANTASWMADVTSANTGTVDTTGLGIPADCRLQYQMKVGNLQSSLYQPPYISSDDAWVYFSY